MEGFGDIVSVNWLKANLNHPQLIILDATIAKVTEVENTTTELQILKLLYQHLNALQHVPLLLVKSQHYLK